MVFNVKTGLFYGIATLLIVGCSGSVDGGNSGGSGGNGAAGNGGGGTGGGTGGEGNAGGGMSTGGAGGAGGGVSTGGSGGAGGSIGDACGGFSGVECRPDEYCDYPDDICGAADGQGVCRARPQACPDIYLPVCACDGMVYGNDCDAASAGVDVSNISNCTPPTKEQFKCGHIFCDSATQYCLKTYTDVPGTPDSYSCAPLPAACNGMTPSCTCIGDPCGSPIAGMCAASAPGFMVTCPGG